MPVMQIELDRQSPVPLREQIVSAIRQGIAEGALSAGERLLSSRELAEQLQVNRATVVQSYRDLQEVGLIESGVGRGTFVRGQAAYGNGGLWDPFRVVPDGALALMTAGSATTRIPLARALVHPDDFPLEAVREGLDLAFRKLGHAALEYAPPAGYEPLRECLMQRFADRGVDPDQNEILIVNGCQQGLDLVSRVLLKDGGPVFTSRPSFAGALDLLRTGRTRLYGLPIDADGLDPHAVEEEAARHKPRLLYTVPTMHNPTGVTMSEERREALLETATRFQFPVLEDDWLGELDPEHVPPSLKSRDRTGHVIMLGSMSKVLAPGLRVGWLILPREVYPAFLQLKCKADLATNLPSQMSLHHLLSSGFLHGHARRIRELLKRKRGVVVDGISRHFPAGVRPLGNHSGMVLWLQLPPGVSATRVVEAAREQGIELAPPEPFDPARQTLPGLRIAYSHASEEELAIAMERLGAILHHELSGTPAESGPPLV